MFWLRIIISSIIGAIIGWIVGVLLMKVTFAYDNYRLKRKMNRLSDDIAGTYDLIRELDSRQW